MEEGFRAWTNNQERTDNYHHDENTWLLNECSRTDANRLLNGLPIGTFLVRPRRAGHYALSITCNGLTNHCIIYETERGYGFAEPYNIYESLTSLVLHYSNNSLEEHNDSLTTTLKYPIGSPYIKSIQQQQNSGGSNNSGGQQHQQQQPITPTSTSTSISGGGGNRRQN